MKTNNRLLLSYARETRERGVYIIGNSGCGKSTLALRMMLNDIEAGCGICLVDPKGTTARRLLRYIPKHRVADTIYFSGKDPLPINIMRATDPDEEQNLAGDIAAFFKATTNDVGEAMDSVLLQVTRALVHKRNPPATFLDIFPMLSDATFRGKSVLPYITDNERLLRFWTVDYPARYERSATVSALMHRTFKFEDARLQTLLGNPKDSLNFSAIMDSRKILIANLSGLDADTYELMGLLIISQLRLAAMRRASKPKPYVPFYLYVDEFQNFTSSPFEQIINLAREFRLCLTLINQHIYDLEPPKRQKNVLAMGTKIMFQCDPDDARRLRKFFPKQEKDEDGLPIYPEADELVGLPRFTAYYRGDQSLKLFRAHDLDAPGHDFSQEIITDSRKKYPRTTDQSEPSEPLSQMSQARVQFDQRSNDPLDEFKS